MAGRPSARPGALVVLALGVFLIAAGPATHGPATPNQYPDAESTITDRAGRVCTVPNREVFNYADRLHPTLAFESDPELARFLGTRCGPEFDVRPLLAGARRADQSAFEPPSRVPPPPPRPRPPR